MIINITYPSHKTDKMIRDISGESFSLIERWRMRGIGSGKLQIEDSSPDIKQIISANKDTAYCNIELRKKGIVLGFNTVGRIYAWCIPYYRLNVYYNGGILSVHGPENMIKASPPFNGRLSMDFLKKVLRLKSESNQEL